MLISFYCSACKAKLEIEADASGSHIQCPQCRTMITVPNPGTLRPGVLVGGFRIEELLGSGAMGEVYRARQISMDRDVALKILSPKLTEDKESVVGFLQEVRLIARLEHPNIVTAHEAGEDNGTYYLAMTYVKGEPLDVKLYREGPMPEKAALQTTLKLARALAYAWEEHKLLHRDIKPDNIMMDRHDEPRLMDLGLSMSLKEAGASPPEYVVGTPNYMSPEQAAGDKVDFRSDMYSLGATLYHMLTAMIPFAGTTTQEILDRHANEPLANPRDFNPVVTDSCISLLEIMLARKPGHRHESWSALIGDLERVLAGQAPTKVPLLPGESVLLHAEALGREYAGSARAHHPADARHRRDKPRHMIAAAALALLAVLLFAGMLFHTWRNLPAPGEPSAPTIAEPVAEQPAPATAVQDSEPAQAPGVDAQDAARAAAEEEMRQEEQVRQRILSAFSMLKSEADRLFDAGRAAEAMALVTNYAGAYAAETAADRGALGADYQQRTEAARRTEAQSRLHDVTVQIATDLLAGDFARAQNRVSEASQDLSLVPVRTTLDDLGLTIGRIAALQDDILATFREDIGRSVNISLLSGAETWEIRSVAQKSVRIRKAVEMGFIDRTIRFDDLSVTEKYKRLGKEPSPERNIMRGMLVYQAKKPVAAQELFRQVDTPLGIAMAGQVERFLGAAREGDAQKAFTSLLRAAGRPGGSEPNEELVRDIRKTAFAAADVPRIREAAARFRQTYGDTAVAAKAAPLLAALERVDTVPREVDPALLAQAIERIEKANPQVEKLLSRYDVTDSGIEMDLSNNPELKNIQPLWGLPITRLDMSNTKVGDLSPLRSMPLASLNLAGCPVENISVLEGMPLRELTLRGCGVRNIRPLIGTPLETLDLAGTEVNVITPLSELPLRKLDISQCPVSDVRPLQSLPLKELSLVRTRITDLKALKGMPLVRLNVTATAIPDLAPLEGMPLEWLAIGGTAVTDLAPLRGAPVKELFIDGCQGVTDLAPLEGMPLTGLYMSRTGVKSLDPIKGAGLVALNIGSSLITDLSPLAGMTTLQRVNWHIGDQYRLTARVWDAISKNAGEMAQREAQVLIDTLEGIPAFASYVNSLRALVHTKLSEWGKLYADPTTLRPFAKFFQGHSFLLCPLFMTWEDSAAFCVKNGARLADVDSKEEMDWIAENFGLPGMSVRLGATDEKKEGSWIWTTGQPFKYVNWAQGQPDNYAAHEHTLSFLYNGQWNDLPSDATCPFVMEWDD